MATGTNTTSLPALLKAFANALAEFRSARVDLKNGAPNAQAVFDKADAAMKAALADFEAAMKARREESTGKSSDNTTTINTLTPLPGSPLPQKPVETMMINGSVYQVSTPYFEDKAAEKGVGDKMV